MGRRGYAAEFRRRVLDLVESGRPIADVARDLQISDQTIYAWRRQDRIDQGLEDGLTSAEHAELIAARKRIRELKTEVAIHRRATELLKEQTADPKAVRGHPRDGRRGPSCGGLLQGAGRVGVGLLRLADPPAIGAVDPPRVAD
jgi:transposase